jgi:hypothetical protein
VAAYPAQFYAYGAFAVDQHPQISAYLQSQPKHVLIAGMPTETDSLATFTGRPVFASREHALPYHLGYYSEMQQRIEALIDGYFAESAVDVATFATRYGIDIMLVNRKTFDPAVWIEPRTGRSNWYWQPFDSAIAQRIATTRRFALLELVDRCAVVDDGVVAALPARCLSDAALAGPTSTR